MFLTVSLHNSQFFSLLVRKTGLFNIVHQTLTGTGTAFAGQFTVVGHPATHGSPTSSTPQDLISPMRHMRHNNSCMRAAALAALACLATAAPASATILITEINSNGTGGDFFELYNSGSTPAGGGATTTSPLRRPCLRPLAAGHWHRLSIPSRSLPVKWPSYRRETISPRPPRSGDRPRRRLRFARRGAFRRPCLCSRGPATERGLGAATASCCTMRLGTLRLQRSTESLR